MYKVETYEIKTGIFGASIAKSDAQLGEFLNAQYAAGWELVAMSEMNSDSKNFQYKLVFKKKA